MQDSGFSDGVGGIRMIVVLEAKLVCYIQHSLVLAVATGQKHFQNQACGFSVKMTLFLLFNGKAF